MRAPQPSGTNRPSPSHSAFTQIAASLRSRSTGRHAAARVARSRPGTLTSAYAPARERPARVRPWRRGSPDPVPNSAVKPALAESTAAPGCGRIGRRTRAWRFLFLPPDGASLSGHSPEGHSPEPGSPECMMRAVPVLMRLERHSGEPGSGECLDAVFDSWSDVGICDKIGYKLAG